MFRITSVIVVFAVMCMGSLVSLANAQMCIIDNFSCQSPKRESGMSLNQTQPQHVESELASPTRWSVAGVLTFNEHGFVQTNESASAGVTLFNSDVINQQPLCITMHANPGQSDWVGIAMGKSKLHADFFKQNDLLLILRPSGSYSLLIQGTKTVIASGKATDFVAGGMNKLSLTYDPNDNTVAATINDHVVVDKHPLDKHPFKPVILEAGFRVHNSKLPAKASIDDFRVQTLAEDGKPVASNIQWLTHPIEQFFVEPNQPALLTLRTAKKQTVPLPASVDYDIRSYADKGTVCFFAVRSVNNAG